MTAGVTVSSPTFPIPQRFSAFTHIKLSTLLPIFTHPNPSRTKEQICLTGSFAGKLPFH